MAVTDIVKDKIVSFLGIIVVVVAVAQMLPTLQTSLAGVSGTVPILNFALVGLLIGIGLLIFIIEGVL